MLVAKMVRDPGALFETREWESVADNTELLAIVTPQVESQLATMPTIHLVLPQYDNGDQKPALD